VATECSDFRCIRVVQKTTHSTNNPQIYSQQMFTIAPVEAPQVTPSTYPIWIRLPKSGTPCPFTGLSRSALNALILGKNPPVKSASLKGPYAIRGSRLIHLGSLLAFIEGMATAQNNNK
jgi:hypothetical protein